MLEHDDPRAARRPSRQRVAVAAALAVAALGPAAARAATAPKYYFQIHEVQSAVPLDDGIRTFAGEALKAELASRPEWIANLGGAAPAAPEELAAALGKRKLRGFDMVVKIVEARKETKDPRPGSRGKRLVVAVKLTVLGTTLPGEKMAFTGDGESGAEGEVSDRRMEEETEEMMKDGIKNALKQAVDQVVMKLSLPQSAPLNESKRKKRAKKT